MFPSISGVEISIREGSGECFTITQASQGEDAKPMMRKGRWKEKRELSREEEENKEGRKEGRREGGKEGGENKGWRRGKREYRGKWKEMEGRR